MKLVTVEEMRGLEQAADSSGHSYDDMMEYAGRAVAEATQERFTVNGKHILVLVGPGNNGGDGLVAARYLCQAGGQVVCYLWKERPDDDPNWRQVQALGLPTLHAEGDDAWNKLQDELGKATFIVDALLGTGVSRPIEGPLKALLETVGQVVDRRRAIDTIPWTAFYPPHPARSPSIDESGPIVVAVDVPSGLDCDTGEVDPVTLAADLTVTFAAPKHGQLKFPGAEYVGELVVADIGIDPALAEDIPTEVVTARKVSKLLPARPLDAHKGTFGRVMIVAGSVNYTGAPYLAAAAAARVGAGLVTLAPPQPLYTILASKLTEATFVLLPHNMGVLVPGAIKVLASHLEPYKAMLLGPGLGREQDTVAFVHQLLGVTETSSRRQIGFRHSTETSEEAISLPPLVIDADGLNALSEAEKWWTYLPARCVLTPHPGEMARLMGEEVNDSERIAVATAKAQEWNQVIVLKGAFTVVAAPDGRAGVMPFANPGLASAGTGDVLAGSIVGMLVQGLDPFDAAVCGAYLHGLSGRIAIEQMGLSRREAAGLLAGDLLPALPEAMRRLRN